jgi:hypothetical protein
MMLSLIPANKGTLLALLTVYQREAYRLRKFGLTRLDALISDVIQNPTFQALHSVGDILDRKVTVKGLFEDPFGRIRWACKCPFCAYDTLEVEPHLQRYHCTTCNERGAIDDL